MNAIDQFKQFYRTSSLFIKLIVINTVIFVAVNLIDTFFYFFNSEFSIINWLAVPASFSELIIKPYTIITYMFLHEDVLHILFNMMWLYVFGKIFLEFLNSKQLMATYLLGGISGGLLYILAYNFIPVFAPEAEFSRALGASASVLAITVAIAVIVPDYAIMLIILGKVKLKYIALISIVLDLISLRSGNAGGHIAHIGGAAFGLVFAMQHLAGRDITKGISKVLSGIESWFAPKQRFTIKDKNARKMTDPDYNRLKKQHQADIDAILEKIKKSGYESLSKEEKELLFRESKRN